MSEPWTPECVWEETEDGYADLGDGDFQPDDLGKLNEWFNARRGGPAVYEKWRQEHVPWVYRPGTVHMTWNGGDWWDPDSQSLRQQRNLAATRAYYLSWKKKKKAREQL